MGTITEPNRTLSPSPQSMYSALISLVSESKHNHLRDSLIFWEEICNVRKLVQECALGIEAEYLTFADGKPKWCSRCSVPIFLPPQSL